MVEKICQHGEEEGDFEIKQKILNLLVIQSNACENKGGPEIKNIVLTICKQIRMAMDKEMRIFCAFLVTELQKIDDEVVV